MKTLKTFFILLLMSISFSDCYKKSNKIESINKNDTTISELPSMNMPEFIGGSDSLVNYIEKNIIYPNEEKIKKIKGIVKVTFTVNEDGRLTDIKVEEKGNQNFINEAIRVVELTNGMWIPGKRNGKPVKVKCVLPIIFELEK